MAGDKQKRTEGKPEPKPKHSPRQFVPPAPIDREFLMQGFFNSSFEDVSMVTSLFDVLERQFDDLADIQVPERVLEFHIHIALPLLHLFVQTSEKLSQEGKQAIDELQTVLTEIVEQPCDSTPSVSASDETARAESKESPKIS